MREREELVAVRTREHVKAVVQNRDVHDLDQDEGVEKSKRLKI